MYNLNKGNIPPIIKDFPDYDTSPSAYLETKNRLENFLSLALTEQKVELTLSENDINNLYTKGINLNKHEPGKYLYYSIQENSILETKIEWPFFLDSKPCHRRKKIIEFSSKQGELLENSRVIERYNQPVNDSLISKSLDSSPFILFILGVSDKPSYLPFKYTQTVEYKRAITLLEKIKTIEIKNSYLVIKN